MNQEMVMARNVSMKLLSLSKMVLIYLELVKLPCKNILTLNLQDWDWIFDPNKLLAFSMTMRKIGAELSLLIFMD